MTTQAFEVQLLFKPLSIDTCAFNKL